MREILFRGKVVRHPDWTEMNGKWAVGFFVNTIDEYPDPGKERIPEIISLKARNICCGEYSFYDTFEVDPDTVSQYTGAVDKNGRMIFEGDVVQFCEDDRYTFEVTYHGCEWCLVNGVDSRLIHYYCRLANYQQLKVIGNIWDNPELLEGKETENE